MSFQLYKYYTSKNIITLSKSVCIQFILLLTIGCNSEQNRTTMAMPPDEPESFPKLTERNRLLGDLLPERTCYDVKHYLINMDIDVDKKYIKGFVDISASAEENFTSLQFDLARKMKLNGVYYLDQTLKTSRKKDAVFVEFPRVKREITLPFGLIMRADHLRLKDHHGMADLFGKKIKRGVHMFRLPVRVMEPVYGGH